MNDEDRQKAWKHFFLLMAKAAAEQQGGDALGVKLAKRCLPGQGFFTTVLDAMLIGIGGIKEPRKVAVCRHRCPRSKQADRKNSLYVARERQKCVGTGIRASSSLTRTSAVIDYTTLAPTEVVGQDNPDWRRHHVR